MKDNKKKVVVGDANKVVFDFSTDTPIMTLYRVEDDGGELTIQRKELEGAQSTHAGMLKESGQIEAGLIWMYIPKEVGVAYEMYKVVDAVFELTKKAWYAIPGEQGKAISDIVQDLLDKLEVATDVKGRIASVRDMGVGKDAEC